MVSGEQTITHETSMSECDRASMVSEHHFWNQVQPWVIWGCATLFYLFQFILRVSPSVMVSDLMGTFQIDAATVGSIGASAYFAYSIAQVPVGLLLDQWGVRQTILLMLFLCVVGCWGFAHAPDVMWAKISRFFIGLGSAGGFLGCAKIAHLWFPVHRTGLVLGLTIAVGTVGAICGGQPLSYLIQEAGWRTCMEYLVLIGCGISLGMMILIREPFQARGPKNAQKHKQPRQSVSFFARSLWARLRVVLLCPTAWYAACISVGIYLILSVVADMWGGMYLQQVYGLSQIDAAALISTIYSGLLIGAPLLAWVSSLFQSRKLPLWWASITACMGWIVLFYMPGCLSMGMLQGLMFVMGITAGAQVVPFSIVADIIPKTHVAMATAFVNMAAMLAGAFLQYIAGFVLDFFWAGGTSSEGVRLYPEHAFQWALGSLGLLMIVSIITLYRMQETYMLQKKVRS